jgi:hypothetical protein
MFSAAVALLREEAQDSRYPMAQIAPDLLALWCSVGSSQRIALVLQTIPVVEKDPDDDGVRLTEHALALLRQSLTPEATLLDLVERMEMQSIRNGRGASMLFN